MNDEKLDLTRKRIIITFNSGKGDVLKFVEEQLGSVDAYGVIVITSFYTDSIISQYTRMNRK